MIYMRKRKALRIAEVWFKVPNDFFANKYVLYNYQNMIHPVIPLKGEFLLGKKDEQTLVSDLNLSADEILMCCTSNVRNEIRRAKKDGVTCTLYFAEELLGMDGLICQFDDAYAQMNKKKRRASVSVKEYLYFLAKERVLSMSVSKMGDRIVAYHVYITGDGIARLLYSVSVFRDCEEHAERNIIGRANRLLHYEDMICFKKRGFIVYDWGGYAMDAALSSINAFKDGFGGYVVPRYYAKISPFRLISILYSGLNVKRKIWKTMFEKQYVL